MEKKNHLFDDSIQEKVERQRGKKKENEEKKGIQWTAVLMGMVTILFAASILLRIFL